MDPDSASTNPPGRTESPEIPSTRPNPFTEADDSARKRRRTSASASPTSSHEIANPVRQSSPPVDDVDNKRNQSRDADIRAVDDSAMPRTPERQLGRQGEPVDPPSNKVTINLRSRIRSVSPPSNPSNSSSSTQAEPDLRERDSDTVQQSVESIEIDSTQAAEKSLATPLSSSPVPASSPIVEVISVHNNGEDAISEMQDAGITIVDDDVVPTDPTFQFPYREQDESLLDTLYRLCKYINAQPIIEDRVLLEVHEWLQLYLNFLTVVDSPTGLASCIQNESFWLDFPDMIQAMIARKHTILKSPILLPVALKLYSSFAELTAYFVTLDFYILRESGSDSGSVDKHGMRLFSAGYLVQMHYILYRVNAPSNGNPVEPPDSSWDATDHTSRIMETLQRSPGGSIECLSQLADTLIDLIPDQPKIADRLTPISQILADYSRESVRILHFGGQGTAEAKQRLERGHGAWVAISNSLSARIEKYVVYLGSESASSQIQALTTLLKHCLQSDHKMATDVLEKHQKQYPYLPSYFTVEAVAWEWRFNILAILIQSSQMQLRVMAVTTMCSDLITLWKRLCDAGGAENNSSFITHIGSCIEKTDLVDYILGCNCHPEIIVESANIVGFLVVAKLYRMEHTDLLWRGITNNQDPRVADALIRMVMAIINLFDYSALLDLCEKFQTLPMEGFTPTVRLLWENILREMVARCRADQVTLSLHPYKLCLRLLRESSVCAPGSQVAYPEIHFAAMQKFKDLLLHGPDADGRHSLYLNCIEDISAASRTSLGSLWGLAMAIRPAVVSETRRLIDNHDLAKLIIEELAHAIDAGREVGIPAVVAGVTNQPRRDFIMNVIHLQPESIDNELGIRLWSMLVGPESPCPEDRDAGWRIINHVSTETAFDNSFLRTCYTQFLPHLPPSCLCDGALEFVRAKVLLLVNGQHDFVIDNDTTAEASDITQLWRFIFAAQDNTIVDLAIRTLAIDVYLESQAISKCPFHRVQKAHLSLVSRCFHLLKDMAKKIKASRDGSTSDDDDESMVIVATDEETRVQEQTFIRTLQVLRYFLEAHQARPHFSAPDVRSLMSNVPFQIEGDSAQLKYQAFDGRGETEVKHLNIGKLNTAATLLASLREETGFENYRAYYRGRPFLPSEHDIRKSLQDLSIHGGLVLVRREESDSLAPTQMKPGSSPLEIEILTHFQDLWEYLSMEDRIAKEIYNFLTKLPADGHVIDLFESDKTSYKDLFLSGQPYKSLYAIHALAEYTATARLITSSEELSMPTALDSNSLYSRAVHTSLRLLVQAISDEQVLESTPESLQVQLMNSLMRTYIQVLQESRLPQIIVSLERTGIPSPRRLTKILSTTIENTDYDTIPLIASTLAAILRLGLLDRRFWKAVTTGDAFMTTIHQLALFDSRKAARGVVIELITDAVEADDKVVSHETSGRTESLDLEGSYGITQYFWSAFAVLLPQAVKLPDQCHETFGLFQFMLWRASKVGLSSLELDLPALAGRTSDLLLSHCSTEDINQVEPEDAVAKGLTSILHICLQIDESLPTSGQIPSDMAYDLFWLHLFPKQRTKTEETVPRVVLNSETRSKICNIVFRLVQHDRRKFQELFQSLNTLVPYFSQDDDDPYIYELPYQFERSRAIRSPCGYVGLRNLSNTCYFNSLLTQVFMNTEFRRFIIASRIQEPQGSQKLLSCTQRLFGYMQESYRRCVDPTDVISSIKTYDDALIDVHSQMDVDEFYNLLFDRWEAQIGNSDDKRKFRSFYGGQLVQQVKSRECDHISERLEPFSAIQCDIKGKSTLEDSLQTYVDGEVLEGDNKYKCSTCDRHVDAVKRACFKDLPDNMIFHLKRFDFNLRTLQRSKINDYFSFPSTINLRPYTIEHLSNGTDDGDEDIFELVGVLVHSGTAESGHYYSYIRERPSSSGNSSWVEFNDDAVSPWDPSLLQDSTFGGPDHGQTYNASNIPYDKSYSAYMLFYQRRKSLEREQAAMMKQNVASPLRICVNQELRDHIFNENTVILRRHCLFDHGHLDLVQMFFKQAKALEGETRSNPKESEDFESDVHDPDSHELEDVALEVTMSHFDQVVTRTKDIPHFGTFSAMISSAVAGCHHCALAFYDYFNRRHASFRALLQRNPEVVVRTFVGRTLVTSLEMIALHFPHLYDSTNSGVMSIESPNSDRDDHGVVHVDDRLSGSFREPSALQGMMAMLNHLWRYFQVNLRSWDEYFGVILEFANLGDREVSHLLAEDYLLKVLRIIAADPMMDLPANYVRMMHNVLRRANSRPPSYLAIMGLADRLLSRMAPVLGPEWIVETPGERRAQAEEFFWTSEEVYLLHIHPDRQQTSLFVEKLVNIGQSHQLTNSIVGRLVSTGPQMDSRICTTIRKNTQAEISMQPMDHFLRVAAKYVHCTPSTTNAQSIVRHICSQAGNLQNSEGAAFLDFFGAALDGERPGAEPATLMHDHCIRLIPDWAPFLLTYAEGSIRRDTEQLLKDELFICRELGSPEDGDENETTNAPHDEVIRRLGLKCLIYFRDAHVKRRAQIAREVAMPMMRVIGKCQPYFEAGMDINDTDDVDFETFQDEIVTPLIRLIVEEVEDDGSDWEGSCGSSDQIEGNAMFDL